MANARAFLDTNGLVHYNSELMKSLNPESPFKKGLLSKAELPCYSSTYKEVYSKNTGVFYDYEGSNSSDFHFLEENYEEEIYTYTVVLDGTVYENVEVNYESGYYNTWTLLQRDPNTDDILFKIEWSNYSYSVFSTRDENVFDWQDRTDEKRGEVIHSLKIYIKDDQHEYVHKLDSKYLPVSEGISGVDSGVTLGSQVYTYVNNQVAAVQTVLDNVESILVTL